MNMVIIWHHNNKKQNRKIKRLNKIIKSIISMKKIANNPTELIDLFNRMKSAIMDRNLYDFDYKADEFYDDDNDCYWQFSAECIPFSTNNGGNITVYCEGYNKENENCTFNKVEISDWEFFRMDEQSFLEICYSMQTNF